MNSLEIVRNAALIFGASTGAPEAQSVIAADIPAISLNQEVLLANVQKALEKKNPTEFIDAENYDKVRPECVIPPSSGMTFISRELSTNGIHPKTESGQIIGLHEGDAKVTLIVISDYRFGCDTDGYDEQNEIGQVTLTTSEEEKVLKTNNDIEDQTFPKSDSINVGKDGVINILAEALEYSQVIKVVVEQAVEATETLEATSTPTSPATKTPIDPSETPDPTPTETGTQNPTKTPKPSETATVTPQNPTDTPTPINQTPTGTMVLATNTSTPISPGRGPSCDGIETIGTDVYVTGYPEGKRVVLELQKGEENVTGIGSAVTDRFMRAGPIPAGDYLNMGEGYELQAYVGESRATDEEMCVIELTGSAPTPEKTPTATDVPLQAKAKAVELTTGGEGLGLNSVEIAYLTGLIIMGGGATGLVLERKKRKARNAK